MKQLPGNLDEVFVEHQHQIIFRGFFQNPGRALRQHLDPQLLPGGTQVPVIRMSSFEALAYMIQKLVCNWASLVSGQVGRG